jgi:alpha/beta superfamily hydrolase
LSFLPPRPQRLTVTGPAGDLEALLEDPQSASPEGFGVVCHPHPLQGGTLNNKVVHTLARALQESGCPTLRFNFRGVGQSAGRYDHGRGETEDALAVIGEGRRRWPDTPLILAGFSFGSMVALQAAPSAQPARLITVAPAVQLAPEAGIPRPPCPWLIIQGQADTVVDWRDVAAFAARFSPPPQLRLLAGVDHFFHGRLPQLRAAVLEQ